MFAQELRACQLMIGPDMPDDTVLLTVGIAERMGIVRPGMFWT